MSWKKNFYHKISYGEQCFTLKILWIFWNKRILLVKSNFYTTMMCTKMVNSDFLSLLLFLWFCKNNKIGTSLFIKSFFAISILIWLLGNIFDLCTLYSSVYLVCIHLLCGFFASSISIAIYVKHYGKSNDLIVR